VHWAAFPGTLTLSAETLSRLWTELGEAVARAGVRGGRLINVAIGRAGRRQRLRLPL
jgi:creatinine amidohydrolase